MKQPKKKHKRIISNSFLMYFFNPSHFILTWISHQIVEHLQQHIEPQSLPPAISFCVNQQNETVQKNVY